MAPNSRSKVDFFMLLLPNNKINYCCNCFVFVFNILTLSLSFFVSFSPEKALLGLLSKFLFFKLPAPFIVKIALLVIWLPILDVLPLFPSYYTIGVKGILNLSVLISVFW